MLSCLSGPFSASFWHFLALKASHVRKNEFQFNIELHVIHVVKWYLNRHHKTFIF